MSTTRHLQLAVALADAGWHPAAWRDPAARARDLFTAAYWVDQVREARDGRLDFVTIEDSFRLQSTRGSQPDDRTDQVRGRLDAVMIAARIAPLIDHVGIVPTALTTLTEPFAVSTALATLDYISRGRAGWLVRVSTAADDRGYVGPRSIPPPEAVHDEAVDHVEVVRRLWDSWEDDAEIRDAATGRFVDRSRLHYIDFAGPYVSVKGPSITPRPPQGQPLVAATARTPAERALAASNADLVLVTPRDEPDLAGQRAELDAALAVVSRTLPPPLVFADILVFLAESTTAARERRARLDELDGAAYGSDMLAFTGTPRDLAEQLIDWSALGYDGFRLLPAALAHDLPAITRGLVPKLQSRGRFREEYEAATLRGLLGLPRPANRYAIA